MMGRTTGLLLLIALNSYAGHWARAQGPQQGIPAQIQLTPQQQAELDKTLHAWQQKQVKDFSCSFIRWEYDEALGPQQFNFQISEAKGVMRYQSPDKGLFQVDEIRKYNIAKNSFEVEKDAYEKWQCDGKSIFMFDYRNKLLKEHPLPPNLQGKEIINGPLPFLFGVDAQKLKERYWMQVVPAPNPGQICIQAIPRWQQDAANYRMVDLILTTDLMPFALQVWDPNNGKSRTVYRFDQFNQIAQLMQLNLGTPNTPFGWKYVKEEVPGNNPQQQPAQNPGAAQAPGSPLPVR